MSERAGTARPRTLRGWLHEYDVDTRRFWIWTAVTGPLFPALWIATVASHRARRRREETARA